MFNVFQNYKYKYDFNKETLQSNMNATIKKPGPLRNVV